MNKERMPKISVIVTVHNAEDTLMECVKSASDQTFQDMEILCIDGGSKDSSPEILRELARRDSRIRIINDKNTSYGHKINVGVELARGKYISILESDDSYKKEMLEHLYGLAEEYQADFVDSDYTGVYVVDNIKCEIPVSKYTDRECYDRLQTIGDREKILQASTGAIWTGLYKKEFLMRNQIKMFESPGAAYQDTSFRFLVSALAERVFHSSQCLYRYRMDNVNSSIHDMKKIFAISEEYGFLEKQISKRALGDEVWRGFYRWKYGSYYWNSGRLTGSGRNLFLAHYKDELKKDIESSNIQRGSIQEQFSFLMLDDEAEFLRSLDKFYEDGNLEIHKLHKMVHFLLDKKVVLFGAGVKGKRILDILKGTPVNIQGICDNDHLKWHTNIDQYHIYGVEEACRKFPHAVFVIPGGKFAGEMEEQLKGTGVRETCIYRT